MASNDDETVTFNHLPDVAAALTQGLRAAVKKAALDVQAHAKVNAPVDTGYLRNSVYTVTADSSDYSGGDKSLPEVPTPDDDGHSALTAVGANYAEYVENGTRYMAARPFFTPAVDTVRGTLERVAIRAILAALKEHGIG